MGIFDRENSGTATMERQKTENRTETTTPGQGMTNPSTTPQTRSTTSTTTGSQTGMTSGTMTGRSRATMTLKVRWTNTDGDVYSECMQTLTPNGRAMGTLHLTKPEGWPAGQYRMEIYLNENCAASMDFEFK